MTSKEKAKELYKKYEFVYIQNYTSKHEVKECALIAVDEIIKYAERWGDMAEDDIKEFEDLKKEITNL